MVLRERASHEGDNARQSRLVDIETIEESFDDNYGLAVIHGPVQIEEDQRFAEPGRKAISRFGLAKRSSCISDKAVILIVNGYHDAPLHVALSRKETNPKVLCSFWADSPLPKIVVVDINILEAEGKRRIGFFADR
ncbi:MAG TPA: hypothetical protein VFC15_20090 [Candidatus Limnocylindrales bacterium]|nr:hypothetical protein [Candidatus Limnocylindrales bacterium]